MCTVLLPPGDNPIAVNKYIIYQEDRSEQLEKGAVICWQRTADRVKTARQGAIQRLAVDISGVEDVCCRRGCWQWMSESRGQSAGVLRTRELTQRRPMIRQHDNKFHSAVQTVAAVEVRFAPFWDVTHRILVVCYRRFGTTYRGVS